MVWHVRIECQSVKKERQVVDKSTARNTKDLTEELIEEIITVQEQVYFLKEVIGAI